LGRRLDDVSITGTPLHRAMDLLRAQSGVNIALVGNEDVDAVDHGPITLRLQNTTVGTVLKLLFQDRFDCTLSGDIIVRTDLSWRRSNQRFSRV